MEDAEYEVVNVFAAADGRGGNPLGVFLEPGVVPEADYQRVAHDLGFSETVFVENQAEARLRIFTPVLELPLAGHPLVGASWLLHRRGHRPSVLRPPAADVPTWRAAGLTWIRVAPDDAPHFDFVQMDSSQEVDQLAGTPDGGGRTVAWAWSDRVAGAVRARAFLEEFGIAEDEATGAAAIRLCALVGRPLRVHQGRRSVLHVRPGEDGRIELGGGVAPDKRRSYRLS